MAKKQQTPESIKNAPKLRPLWVWRHRGPNRAERRHYVVRNPHTGKPVELPRRRKTIPRRSRAHALNVPYRKKDQTA